jgi:putative transposase
MKMLSSIRIGAGFNSRPEPRFSASRTEGGQNRKGQQTASTAAIENYNSEQDTKIELRQVKYLNNIVEQDHRAIKRKVRPMLGLKSFWSASVTLAGIELMHMIRKGQLKATGRLRPAQQFYSLAS